MAGGGDLLHVGVFLVGESVSVCVLVSCRDVLFGDLGVCIEFVAVGVPLLELVFERVGCMCALSLGAVTFVSKGFLVWLSLVCKRVVRII